ncbi:VOC family protein [Nevskia soli]|jgi:PhnB protein|uniref:VOC family protein n=1 Tax=Nevskia soli TaxID=418856 RepID=UPI0015D88898|nr:VOC family protein [Nevskia soli]
MAVNAIPESYASVTPYLIVKGAARAIEFYKEVFGAIEEYRMPMPDGRIGHLEFRIGNSKLMMADESPEYHAASPQSLGGSPVTLALSVPDVDTIFARALGAGSKERRPVKTQFYGERSGTMVDPFGHVWTIATRVENVAPEEMQKRMGAAGSS